MNRQQFLPSTLTFLLTIAVLLYLVEKLGSALLAFSNVLVMLGLSWLLALILRPLVNWVQRRTLTDEMLQPIRRRWGDRWADRVAHPSLGLSITIVYTLVIAVIAIIGLALVPLLIEQTRQLSITIQEQADNLPANIQRLSEIINSARTFLIDRLYLDPAAIVLPRPEELINQVTGFGTGLVQGALGLLGGIAATLGQFMLIVFLSVLVMIDGAKMQTQLQQMIPRKHEADVQTLIRDDQSGLYRLHRRDAVAKRHLRPGGDHADDAVRDEFGGGGGRGVQPGDDRADVGRAVKPVFAAVGGPAAIVAAHGRLAVAAGALPGGVV